MKNFETRADPDFLINAIAKKRKTRKGGRLFLFVGMAPGVGKTFAMLQAAHEAKRVGTDIVCGVVETHGRVETENLLQGLPIVPKKTLQYRGREFSEMDIDAILARRPHTVLVDELAHTNVPGSRHTKRWQDVFEILDAGIDVYSTMNVQHLESRKDAVEKIANITIFETVPDQVLDRAFQIQLIDLSVPDLLKRIKEGKVYLGDKADLALGHFFKEEKLTAMREIALRLTAERVDTELQSLAFESDDLASLSASDKIMVAVGYGANSESMIRAARRMAYNLETPWMAVHVFSGEEPSEKAKMHLAKNLELARLLGAETLTVTDTNVADALVRVAQQKYVTHIMVGRSPKIGLRRWWSTKSLYDQLVERTDIMVSVLGPEPSEQKSNFFGQRSLFKAKSTSASFVKAISMMLLLNVFLWLLTPYISYRAVGFVLLLGILVMGLLFNIGPVVCASILGLISWNLFFIPPLGSFHVSEPEDIFLCISFLTAALATGLLTRRIKYQQEILLIREQRSDTLSQILLDMPNQTSARALCAGVATQLEKFLRGDCDFVLLRKDKSITEFVRQNLNLPNLSRELAVAKWVVQNSKSAGRFTDTLSSASALYIPLKGSFDMMGALAFQRRDNKTPSIEDMDFLFTIAHHTAVALEKLGLHKKAVASQNQTALMKSYQSLLTALAKELREYFLAHEADAQLMFLLNDFLLASRISSGIFPLKREAIGLFDLFGLAANELNKINGPLKIEIKDLSNHDVVHVEKGLFKQILCHIILYTLDNASHEGQISVEVLHRKIILTNNAHKLTEEQIDHLFDKTLAIENNSLGLIMAKSIIKAHEGKILASADDQGSLVFTISLAN